MFSSIPIKNFMEKKKKSEKNSNSYSNNDDIDHRISIVKAAAWAWYQHGSGSNYEESEKMREFDVRRSHQAPKPSRYKLEAIKMIKENFSKETQMQSPVNKENSLLDDYEIECISKRFDDFIDSSGSKRLYLDRHVNNKSSFSDGYIIISNSSNNRVSKRKNKNFLKGLWPRNATVCGARNDVDSRACDRSPLPVAGRYGPVVNMAVCRPGAGRAL